MDMTLLMLPASFCGEAQPIFYTVGMFLLVFKIVIPILLIIFGMIDLGKAVVQSDDKAVSNAAKKLLNRIIAGVCIFFVPTIIGIVFNMIGGFKTDVKDGDNKYTVCSKCISSPNSDVCKNGQEDVD